MLKALLMITGLLVCCWVQSQQPVSFPNAHVYTDLEGVKQANLSRFCILPNGQVIVTAYDNGATYFIGNTKAKIILPDNMHDFGSAYFYVLGRDTFAVYDKSLNDTMFAIQRYVNNHLTPIPNAPQKTGVHLYIPNWGLLYNAQRQNHWQLEKFDGKKFSSFNLQGFEPVTITKDQATNQYLAAATDSNQLYIFFLDTAKLTCTLHHSYPLLPEQQKMRLNFIYSTGASTLVVSFDNQCYQIAPRINKKIFTEKTNKSVDVEGITYYDGRHPSGIIQFTKQGMKETKLPTIEKITGLAYDTVGNSIYVGSYTKLYRFFEHIKQYPSVFQKTGSSAIFSLQQAADGTIWAGSYDALISKIDNNKIEPVTAWNKPVLPGGLTYVNNVYFLSEGGNIGRMASGIYVVNKHVSPKQIGVGDLPAYYLYQSKHSNKVYLGTGGDRGLWMTDSVSLQKGKPVWEKIDASKGMLLSSILTITEDKQGHVWMGCHTKGIAIYYPAEEKAETFLIKKKQIAIGAMSSLTDSYGTVWLGTQKGLWYYNKNKPGRIQAKDIQQLEHPLLDNVETITSMRQWSNWLVLGASDRIALLNLAQWYASGKIILRYLNPQETNFTSSTEQNTMLIDKRDSSIWFSTSDMLYQWDIKKWLSLSLFKVQPHLLLNGKTLPVQSNGEINVGPTENTLTFNVEFQTPNNMFRYLSFALVKEGDSIALSAPSLKTNFPYSNLSSGNYKVVLQLFEQDGTTSTYQYNIIINKFLWQRWWFWALITGGIISIAVYLINLQRKKQIAEEQAKRISAEAEALKSEQNRQLTKMQVVSLSSQFRPHFILNALNTIGAQLHDKPDVDVVLEQLGESINIIFRNAQAGNIAHPLAEEWKLVENVINIKQMEFRHEVKVIVTHQNLLQNSTMLVPMGLLQIPVENALIHGLRNKESGNKQLFIVATDATASLEIKITDNGIGRKAAAAISNYRKHGVGTKNLLAVIELLNSYNTDKIQFSFEDDVFETNAEKHGTNIIINIPKNFNYGIA